MVALIGVLSSLWFVKEAAHDRSLNLWGAGAWVAVWTLLLTGLQKPCRRQLQYQDEFFRLSQLDRKLKSLSSFSLNA